MDRSAPRSSSRRSPNVRDFDFIIVGSGFGGSVSALRLAEKGYSVAVIEMGKRWNAEDYPETNWIINKFLWAPMHSCYGCFRMTLLKDVFVLSGAGVGGGSLNLREHTPVPKDAAWDDPCGLTSMTGRRSCLPSTPRPSVCWA